MKYLETFIDTNILVYAHDRRAGAKHSRARELILRMWSDSVIPNISAQVLHELFVNLLKKGATQVEASQACEYYCSWRVIENDKALFLTATQKMKRYQLSFWDSLIIAAAQKARATVLWSEDLNPGQNFDGVIVKNPLLG